MWPQGELGIECDFVLETRAQTIAPPAPRYHALLLLLLLPPLTLLPQLQGVRAPPLLPRRLLPPEGRGTEAELGRGEETRVKGGVPPRVAPRYLLLGALSPSPAAGLDSGGRGS